MTEDRRQERLRKWRLILGKEAASGEEGPSDPQEGEGPPNNDTPQLEGEEAGMDDVLEALYQPKREGSLGPSAPNVNRWLGDIRRYFPTPVVRIMQQDALHRLGLKRMLLEPELLEQLEPDVELVASLLSLRQVLPDQTRATARLLVQRVAHDIERRLRQALEQAVRGSLRHQARNLRPTLKEMDWHRTIRANLRHYQIDYQTIIPQTLIGFGHRKPRLRDLILLVDLSGSMAASVVYAGVVGCILASLPALRTRLITFDTEIADLTDHLSDPVELLFGLNLGGGTDIGNALAYARQYIDRPTDTLVFLLSDLYEGASAERLLAQAAAILRSGAKLIVLLALDDQGAPAYEHEMARKLAELGAPAFASTPDQFAPLLASALEGKDLDSWHRHMS